MSPTSSPAARGRQGSILERVRPGEWRARCESVLAGGHRYCGAYATRAGRVLEWTALFAAGSSVRALRTEVDSGIDSIVDIVPACDWDEREARDLFGLEPAGRDSTRPLANHDVPLESWTVPVSGADTSQVAVGPIHAGVIESGHFRFHVVGERILLVDLRLFYKHRGLEAAACGRQLGEALAHAQRACAACAVTNSVAYAQAAEAVQGLSPPPALRRTRTVLLELERLYNHLHDIAAICAGVGFAPGNMAFAALKERVLRINAVVGGHRFLFGTVAVGRSELELAGAGLQQVRAELRSLHTEAASCWRELVFAASLQSRLENVGVLSTADAQELGTVGPAARASGERLDTRTVSPALAYGSDFSAVKVDEPAGDVGARMRVRAAELEQSLELLDELLDQPLESSDAGCDVDPATFGVARVESPRGETVCAIDVDGSRLRRFHLRTGSYANWPSLAHAAAGELLPDFPLINKSFELCYACADR